MNARGASVLLLVLLACGRRAPPPKEASTAGHVASAAALPGAPSFVSSPGAEPGTPIDAPALDDAEVVACIVGRFAKLTFPKPEGGIVTVVYPIIFAPAH
jgi:hypothetical protein